MTAFVFGQQVDYVDFKKAKANIGFGDLIQKEVFGAITFEFEILKDIDSVYLDARNFEKIHCVLNGKELKTVYDGEHIIVKHPFQSQTQHTISITWEVKPKKAMYFIDWGSEAGNKQIWTQGQGKYTSNWLPSIDDMNDKIEFDLSIEFDKNYQVISNGTLTAIQIKESTIVWHYDMDQPMSSYLVALAIGRYSKQAVHSKSGIPLEMYYYPEDSLKFEPTYRYTKQMFDFLEEEIGIPYPWKNYKQVPVKDFLYAGMENTSTTIFTDSFVIDSIAFVDKNYVNVNAHELAHQWFGDLVTETSGTHHWLQEGFATYYALLAEKEVFGANYYHWKLYEYAQELLAQDKLGQSTSLLDPNSSSTTFYKKGAWVLHMLREQVGDKIFKTAVKNYLQKHQFKNVETDDFIKEVENASGRDLSEFVKIWLKSELFQNDKALKSLNKSKFIKAYLLVNCDENDSKCSTILSSNISDESKIKVISQNPRLVEKGDFKNSLKVRQAIALNLTEIPSELKIPYESLLEDPSYSTIEKALFNLWLNFPQERNKYLNKIKEIQGHNDKNVRILWLTLALITEEFQPENKPIYFQELINYTNPSYAFEIRQNAFLYLQQINACNDACLTNLEQATKHHSWQFSKFAKTMLELIKTNQK
ncbi:M1 family metallopeptidase [Mariniflexile sp. AS56]|uniref:M1 family metallopeptidase n=1 Tax=Mariniflexile sp. AS56 TaxID=3063957 RepID=UPI0026EBB84F|nr:M1 family metallopeptidase [Mariniflexile sp. AS56]MDO7171273.1 M1 family metallopeptidase [Mariniflexile sp. AS56]